MKTCHNLFAKCRNTSIQLLAEQTGDVVFIVFVPRPYTLIARERCPDTCSEVMNAQQVMNAQPSFFLKSEGYLMIKILQMTYL